MAHKGSSYKKTNNEQECVGLLQSKRTKTQKTLKRSGFQKNNNEQECKRVENKVQR